MKTIFVKPKGDLTIRDPKTMVAIPKEGALVEKTSYWQRRINDGDVTEAEEGAEDAAPEAAAQENDSASNRPTGGNRKGRQ